MNSKNKPLGFLALLTDGFILALFGLFARLMKPHMSNPMQIFSRMLLVSLLLAPYLWINRKKLAMYVGKLPLFITFILSFPVYVLFFTVSVNAIKVANAFFYIFIATTLTSYLIGNIFFREKIGTKEILVSSLLTLGLLSFMYPFNQQQNIGGIIAGFLSGVAWGISNATRKYYDGKIDRWLVIYLQMLVGAFLGLFLAIGSHSFYLIDWNVQASIVLFFYATGNIVVQYLLFIGLKNFDLNLSSIVLASQLVFVVIVGMVFLKELPTQSELLGALLVSAAIVMSKQNTSHKYVVKE